MKDRTLTFAALCSLADRMGADVGVECGSGGHVITLVDFGRCRSLRIPVPASFDAAVSALCLSLALIRDVPGCVGDGVAILATWPELADLASSTRAA